MGGGGGLALPLISMCCFHILLFPRALYAMDVELSNEDQDFATPIRFGNGRFANPPSFKNWKGLPGFWDLVRRRREPNRAEIPSSEQELSEHLPIREPTFNKSSELEATWIGHDSLWITMEGISFMTDPIFSERASPVRFMGTKRYRPPPCSVDELPENLHFVLISHNHYDHLDLRTVQELTKRYGAKLKWFVPMGLKSWMVENGCDKEAVQELTWGQRETVNFENKTFTIHCLPAQHWSLRGLFDLYKSLWCSWAVEGSRHKFYFAGDTGFCDEEFGKIGTKLGPFDLAAIPIGVYSPRWFTESQHIGPEEAVQVHKLIRSKRSIGVHWGTFDMGSSEVSFCVKYVFEVVFPNESEFKYVGVNGQFLCYFYLEPRNKLRELTEKAGLGDEEFVTVEHGRTNNFA